MECLTKREPIGKSAFRHVAKTKLKFVEKISARRLKVKFRFKEQVAFKRSSVLQ